jgi:peptidoglycan/xylan/chitin deacetylase (PgdA/CDA1 family)
MPSSKYRIDRALSLNLVKPLKRLTQSARRFKIPILMYHSIRADAATSGHPFFETRTAPKVFAAQMRYLRDQGYRTVDLDDATALLAANQDISKVVAITFDDGFEDFYSAAFPVLLECEFTATVFVVPGFLQGKGSAVRENTYLAWDEVREIHEYGIRVGSHTMNHSELGQLPWSAVALELNDSRKAIEDVLGSPVLSFAYPYAFPEHDRNFIRNVKVHLENAGYRNAVTTIVGTAGRGSDPYLLPRIPVNTHDDLELFEAKISGAYDWMHAAQYARKLLGQSKGARQRRMATAPIL